MVWPPCPLPEGRGCDFGFVELIHSIPSYWLPRSQGPLSSAEHVLGSEHFGIQHGSDLGPLGGLPCALRGHTFFHRDEPSVCRRAGRVAGELWSLELMLEEEWTHMAAALWQRLNCPQPGMLHGFAGSRNSRRQPVLSSTFCFL